MEAEEIRVTKQDWGTGRIDWDVYVGNERVGTFNNVDWLPKPLKDGSVCRVRVRKSGLRIESPYELSMIDLVVADENEAVAAILRHHVDTLRFKADRFESLLNKRIAGEIFTSGGVQHG